MLVSGGGCGLCGGGGCAERCVKDCVRGGDCDGELCAGAMLEAESVMEVVGCVVEEYVLRDVLKAVSVLETVRW